MISNIILINFLITLAFSANDGLFPLIFKNIIGSGCLLSLSFFSYSSIKMIAPKFTKNIFHTVCLKKILGLSLLLYIIVSLIISISVNPYLIIFSKLIQGLACAFFRPVLLSLVASMSQQSNIGATAGKFDTAFYLALAIGPAIGGVFFTNFGKIGILSLVILCCLFSFAIYIHFYITFNVENGKSDSSTFKDKNIEINYSLQQLLIFTFFKAWCISTLCVYLPVYMNNAGFSATHIGIAVGLPSFIMAVILTKTGILADKYNKQSIVFWGGVISSFNFIMIPFSKDIFVISLIIILYGLGSAISQPACLSILIENSKGKNQGYIYGIFNTTMGTGFSLSPFMNCFLTDYFGINTIFYTAGILGLISSAYFMRNYCFKFNMPKTA